jgi:hypothetical protein
MPNRLPWDIVILIAALYALACLIIARTVSSSVHIAAHSKRALAARYRQFRKPRQTGNDQHYGDSV